MADPPGEYQMKQKEDNTYGLTKGIDSEVRLLILYTGGTFGMMKTDNGYSPCWDYLLVEKILKSNDFYDHDFTARQRSAPKD